jgi:hypothetical protein
MRVQVIACEVLARQLYYVAAFSPHVVDIRLLGKGLHNEPDVLRAALQEALDGVAPGEYSAILLGYGLCSNSIAGLSCPHTKMVVPRAHDCITLYLGSADRYAEQFRANPGTYWYAPDYMERSGKDSDHVSLGSGGDDNMQATYEEYVAKYGRENADYLMEVMGAWRAHYNRAAYIDTQEMALPDYTQQVRESAERRGWTFERLAGSLILLRDLIDGRWDAERFLTVEPGAVIQPSHDARIVCQAWEALGDVAGQGSE